ncbi:hypothetical protein NL676_036415 [Syzygium grande]|nr:hypothetical protein NL676_036415 [Syzygium grande]
MIVAIHAAVGGGTGLDLFQKGFPDRCFDVGNAGQHTVTFAAGLAAEGVKPFCATCSSFLQRGFDQVRFAMVVMAPSCKAELMHTVATAAAIDDQPSCFMYLRGNGIGAVLPPNNKGTPLERCVAASELLEVLGIPRFCEQLDGNLIHELAKEHKVLITVEEGSIQFPCLSFLGTLNGLLDGHLNVINEASLKAT